MPLRNRVSGLSLVAGPDLGSWQGASGRGQCRLRGLLVACCLWMGRLVALSESSIGCFGGGWWIILPGGMCGVCGGGGGCVCGCLGAMCLL